MERIYDATGKEKIETLAISNGERAYYKLMNPISLQDFALVGITNQFPYENRIMPETTYWTLNGVANSKMNDEFENLDIVIIEPLLNQIGNNGLVQLREWGTFFEQEIKLSGDSTILMPFEKYKMIKDNPEFLKRIEGLNLALYVGDKEQAAKMVLTNNDFIWFNMGKYGFDIEEKDYDLEELAKKFRESERLIIEMLSVFNSNIKYRSEEQSDVEEKSENDSNDDNSVIISGVTTQKEGDIELDEKSYASINIGKKRKNQEDAVLLVKDEMQPDFRMLAVADGMGGEEYGEIASDLVVSKLREWFRNLSSEQRNSYYNSVSSLQTSLEKEISKLSLEVFNSVNGLGGTTLVCAVVGKNDTLVVNVGDSRAYIGKNGELKQVTIEDSVVQEDWKKGDFTDENGETISKDYLRFHRESNIITQCLGERKIKNIHSALINNSDYDMLLLFSDGVTDCLSDERIAVICRNSDKKEISKRLVRHASIHDSVAPQELYDILPNINGFIFGGKDNSTAAVYLNEKDEER